MNTDEHGFERGRSPRGLGIGGPSPPHLIWFELVSGMLSVKGLRFLNSSWRVICEGIDLFFIPGFGGIWWDLVGYTGRGEGRESKGEGFGGGAILGGVLPWPRDWEIGWRDEFRRLFRSLFHFPFSLLLPAMVIA